MVNQGQQSPFASGQYSPAVIKQGIQSGELMDVSQWATRYGYSADTPIAFTKQLWDRCQQVGNEEQTIGHILQAVQTIENPQRQQQAVAAGSQAQQHRVLSTDDTMNLKQFQCHIGSQELPLSLLGERQQGEVVGLSQDFMRDTGAKRAT